MFATFLFKLFFIIAFIAVSLTTNSSISVYYSSYPLRSPHVGHFKVSELAVTKVEMSSGYITVIIHVVVSTTNFILRLIFFLLTLLEPTSPHYFIGMKIATLRTYYLIFFPIEQLRVLVARQRHRHLKSI